MVSDRGNKTFSASFYKTLPNLLQLVMGEGGRNKLQKEQSINYEYIQQIPTSSNRER